LDPMSDKKNQESPTWEDIARLRRLNQKLSAEVVVLKEEIAGLETEKAEHEDEAEGLQKSFDKKSVTLKRVEAALLRLDLDVQTKARLIVRLEQENGELEARLARALGRTFVVTKNDEIAALVSGLVQIAEWCEHNVGRAGEKPARMVVNEYDVDKARLRQLRDHARLLLERVGVKEQQRELVDQYHPELGFKDVT
jgi:chromosome segregation ATPase